MTSPLQSLTFRRAREGGWRALHRLLDQAERKGLDRLSAEELTQLARLHRRAMSSLGVARAISLERNTLEYLESLCQRSFLCVYGARRPVRAVIRTFLGARFPQVVRRYAIHLLLAFSTMILGMVVAWTLTAREPGRFHAFVPSQLAAGRGPHTPTLTLRAGLYGEVGEAGELGLFSSFLFTHNARVGLLCFALGFAAGVPVFILLFVTGLMLGAFGALYQSRGLGPDLWGWLLPHGITELLAIGLCAAGGLILAERLLFPRNRARLLSLAEGGRDAGVLVVGAVGMFFIAGLLEGFFRQLVTDIHVRYLVAAASAVGWSLYFGLAGRDSLRS